MKGREVDVESTKRWFGMNLFEFVCVLMVFFFFLPSKSSLFNTKLKNGWMTGGGERCG